MVRHIINGKQEKDYHSLSIKILHYFCYWQMCFMELEGKFKAKDNPLRQIPNSIKTKEEYIEEMGDKISQMIDACGKETDSWKIYDRTNIYCDGNKC